MADKTIGITAKKAENFTEWYPEVIVKSEFAEYSAVKGCIVMRPSSMAVWEKIQEHLNKRIKLLGVKNAYFPLFIPESFFKKEAEHAAGFKPEVAWIEAEEGEEKLAVRPTSETIMCDSFARWVRSWRDLPLRVNQWCNVVRWETKQTRLFLRLREFLWQEGHCLYATEEEADHEVALYLKEYQKMIQELLAIPIIVGRKTQHEKFAGAKYTIAVEALMPDGRALQCGTSHNLGQGFVKSFNIEYVGKDEKMHHPYHISWGVSVRLLGAMVMMHSDDKGLVLPPKVAPVKAVIVPILFEGTKDRVMAAAKQLHQNLKHLDVELDDREEYSPGWKFNEWELKGIPVRIELGPKDLDKGQAVLARRDGGKQAVALAEVPAKLSEILEQMQKDLYARAEKFLHESTAEAGSWEELTKHLKAKKLVLANFCGEPACEEAIKTETDGATTRCIPKDSVADGVCVHCKKKAEFKVYFAKAY